MHSDFWNFSCRTGEDTDTDTTLIPDVIVPDSPVIVPDSPASPDRKEEPDKGPPAPQPSRGRNKHWSVTLARAKELLGEQSSAKLMLHRLEEEPSAIDTTRVKTEKSTPESSPVKKGPTPESPPVKKGPKSKFSSKPVAEREEETQETSKSKKKKKKYPPKSPLKIKPNTDRIRDEEWEQDR